MSVRDVGLQARAALVEGDPGGGLVCETRPAFGRVREGLCGAAAEVARARVPSAALDLYVRVLEPKEVEGVRLAAAHAVRGGRARLNVERGVALNLVALGGVARLADVHVAREQKVCAASRERLHRHRRAADYLALVRARGHVEGVVRDDYLDDLVGVFAQAL